MANPDRYSIANLEEEKITCPLCDQPVITRWQLITFQYGQGQSAVELSPKLPVRCCQACEFDFLDGVGRMLKHEAVCRHLNLLNPRQIRWIRLQHRLSLADFAKQTGLDEMSLERWERGDELQPRVHDIHLRLLSQKDVIARQHSTMDGLTEQDID